MDCRNEQMLLLAALEVFQRTLRKMGPEALEPEGRRRLVILWLPCQAHLDRVVEHLPPERGDLLRLLRREVEDTLLDEPCSVAALAETLDALEHLCRWGARNEPDF